MKCIKCKIKLTKQNSNQYDIRECYYICKKCNTIITKSYDVRYRLKEIPKDRKRWRERYLTLKTGKFVVCKKRTYPKNSKCELCKKVNFHLAYHHWDDTNTLKGLWICKGFECHVSAEAIDKSHKLINRYLKLKEQINYESMRNI